jgi:hypothetical protein
MNSVSYIDTIIEHKFDSYKYRELMVDIHDVEEKIKVLQSKTYKSNNKMIKSRGKLITVLDFNERRRKEELEYLRNRLKNLRIEVDTFEKGLN